MLNLNFKVLVSVPKVQSGNNTGERAVCRWLEIWVVQVDKPYHCAQATSPNQCQAREGPQSGAYQGSKVQASSEATACLRPVRLFGEA